MSLGPNTDRSRNQQNTFKIRRWGKVKNTGPLRLWQTETLNHIMTYLRTAKRSNYVLCCGKLLFCLAQAVIMGPVKYVCGSYSCEWGVKATSMKQKTGMLRTEQQNLQQHTQLWHDVILYSDQQTSIYGQICKKKVILILHFNERNLKTPSPKI